MITILDYCKQTIGFNPFNKQGKEMIKEKFKKEMDEFSWETPHMSDDYYAECVIDDKIISNYLDLMAIEGVNVLLVNEPHLLETQQVLLGYLMIGNELNKFHSFSSNNVIVFRAKNINNMDIEDITELWNLNWDGQSWRGDGMLITDEMLSIYAENNIDKDGYTYFVEEQ